MASFVDDGAGKPAPKGAKLASFLARAIAAKQKKNEQPKSSGGTKLSSFLARAIAARAARTDSGGGGDDGRRGSRKLTDFLQRAIVARAKARVGVQPSAAAAAAATAAAAAAESSSDSDSEDEADVARRERAHEALLADPAFAALAAAWQALMGDHAASSAGAKALSKRARKDKRLGYRPSLTYGEISFPMYLLLFRDHLAPLLDAIVPASGGVFYDIGTGIGKPVFGAALAYPKFRQCVGIEVLEALCNEAIALNVTWRSLVEAGKVPDGAGKATEIRFLCGTADDTDDESDGDEDDRAEEDDGLWDWAPRADLVFANSTCFTKSLMRRLAFRARKMRPGTLFVTTTKGLGSKDFELLRTMKYPMSWGKATVFIQVRRGGGRGGGDDEDLQTDDDVPCVWTKEGRVWRDTIASKRRDREEAATAAAEKPKKQGQTDKDRPSKA